MKNSKLRKQLEDLESENRRLLLAREVSLSPAEITRTARNLGFREVIAGPALPTLAAAKTPLLKSSVEKSSFPAAPVSITMTASQMPVKGMTAGAPKAAAAKAEPTKQKSIKPELMAIVKR